MVARKRWEGESGARFSARAQTFLILCFSFWLPSLSKALVPKNVWSLIWSSTFITRAYIKCVSNLPSLFHSCFLLPSQSQLSIFSSPRARRLSLIKFCCSDYTLSVKIWSDTFKSYSCLTAASFACAQEKVLSSLQTSIILKIVSVYPQSHEGPWNSSISLAVSLWPLADFSYIESTLSIHFCFTIAHQIILRFWRSLYYR